MLRHLTVSKYTPYMYNDEVSTYLLTYYLLYLLTYYLLTYVSGVQRSSALG